MSSGDRTYAEGLPAALLPAVPVIVEAAIAAIRAEIPTLPDLGVSGSGLERNLRRGLADAVHRWFGGGAGAERDLHFALGHAQARAGRTLEELMGFYRIAAQTMWRRLTEVGAARGIDPADLYRLAETGFGCVDEISTQAAEGFAEEQSHRSGTVRSRRSELVRLLLEEPQPPVASLAEAAQAVGIELTASVAFFAGAAERYDAFSRAAHDLALLGPREGEFAGALFDPDGPGRRSALAAAATRAGATIALGPSVLLAQARGSLARARSLLALARRGLVPSGGLLHTDEHDMALLLSADPRLAEELAHRALVPLRAVRGEATRANLAATLQAWLRTPGQRKAIAHALGVHPQTVRYRMARLRELFGPALDDAEGRFRLELAFRIAPYSLSGVVYAPLSPPSTRNVDAVT